MKTSEVWILSTQALFEGEVFGVFKTEEEAQRLKKELESSDQEHYGIYIEKSTLMEYED